MILIQGRRSSTNISFHSPSFNSFKIIHRRIIILLYQWITSVPANIRPDIYNVLVTFLNNPDMAIKLTAALSLDICVLYNLFWAHLLDISDMEFNADHFGPYLNTTIERLFYLISVVETGESKLKLITVMNNLIDQVGDKVIFS